KSQHYDATSRVIGPTAVHISPNDGRLFRRGTPAGGNRLVWLAGLQRHATHARDRHPHGARRAAARRAGLGRWSRDAARVIGSRYRAGSRTGPFTRAANVALRRQTNRSAYVRWRVVVALAGGVARFVGACATRCACRSDGGAAL